ncbi:restriction endonuclease subunit S [Enterobacter sichuanensis]|uniref:restriction endonuclease subunit S n=1 Tax=Enterobacter sichuanensis TaxID=2071710 RepID=UPI0021D1719D|nr:restriction endonuclease subunit S [Enterobacter sichuanensis]MCU6194194.1 restriction endonuclease subunit S [Enterobacter sichuanensis]
MSYNIPTPKGWQLVKLSDLGEVNRGKSKHRPRDADFLYGGKYPFIQTGDVKASGGRINSFNQTYSDEGLKQSRLWPEETMCITIAANIAETGVLQFPACFPDSVIGFIADKTKCDVYFIEYMFRLLKAKIKSQANGSVQDNINLQTLERILFPIPNLADQKKIAKILGVFDDKIIINNRLIETLEQMAQALFKSWFVDFEPVKAKMAVLEVGGSQEDATFAAMTAISGKDADALAVFEREHPEHYAELKATAELFPSVMQESESGEIPDGWELKSFGDVSKCYDKKRIPLSKPQREKKKGEIPYYGATSIMDYVDEYIFDGIYLLLGEDGSVIKENGLPFTQYIWGKSWVNNHAHVLTGSGSVTTEHLMVFIKQENIAAYVTGAVQMKLNQKNMNSIPFIFADEAVNNVFGLRIDSIYAVIRAKSEENLTLTNLRDTLLPKLLSGEITLPEAEQAVSEAENV